MRREELLLRDILEAIDYIEQFIAGLDRTGFLQSELVRSAVVQKLLVVGEATAHLPTELQIHHPEVPWGKIVAFRNILVHAYFGLDWDEVWRAASKEAPALRSQIELVLRVEFGLEAL